MAKFELSLEYVLKNEGVKYDKSGSVINTGWVNNPNDKGGATNWGITLRTAQRHGFRDIADLKAMTKAQAAEIYRKDFWLYDDIADQRLATIFFDMGVNMGVTAATRLWQCVLYMQGADLALDGKLGPKTIAAINDYRLGINDLLMGIAHAWAGRSSHIVECNPSQVEFLRGWCNRAKKVPQ